MLTRIVVTAALITLPMSALAAEPNLEPGLWETTSTTAFEGPMEMPEQTSTTEHCITAEDLEREGALFFEETDECDITELDVGRDAMRYTMRCEDEDVALDVEGEITFMGDRAEGTVIADMTGPMGQMTMRTTLDGRRVGDCP